MFPSKHDSSSIGTGKRHRQKFLRNLENGDIVGYKSDSGNCPEVPTGEIKHRVYGEPRECLCNYKTVLCKEEALPKVIGRYLEEGLVAGPFSESKLRGKYHQVLLNSFGAEIKDLTRPDVRTLGDATQGWGSRNIHLTTQTTRPSLSDEMMISGPSKRSGRSKIRRMAHPSKGANAETGTRIGLDHGPQRAGLRENRRNFRGVVFRSKLGSHG